MQKTLVITGASKGIGFATASHFQQQGYRIVNLSRSPAPLDDCINIPANLAEFGWLQQHGDALSASIGQSDQISLIHCAAAHQNDRIIDLDPAALPGILQTNLIAPVQLTQWLLPTMTAGSSVLFLGSTLSEKAVANACSYVTSKHGVVGLMRSTCQDLVGSGVHTACICPGFTDTEMLRGHVGSDPQVLDNIAQGVTFKRLIEPDEIAATLYFCATNPVINGAVLHANLGQIES